MITTGRRITCLLANGRARNSQADYLRFLDMAFGSARELDYQLTLAARLGYMPQTPVTELAALSEECLKVLSGLIRSLRSEY